MILRADQVADATQGAALVQALPTGAVIVDRDYDSDAWVKTIEATGVEDIFPPRRNRNIPRKVDWHRYKPRNLIERFFNRLKQVEPVPKPDTTNLPTDSMSFCAGSLGAGMSGRVCWNPMLYQKGKLGNDRGGRLPKQHPTESLTRFSEHPGGHFWGEFLILGQQRQDAVCVFPDCQKVGPFSPATRFNHIVCPIEASFAGRQHNRVRLGVIACFQFVESGRHGQELFHGLLFGEGFFGDKKTSPENPRSLGMGFWNSTLLDIRDFGPNVVHLCCE